MTKQSKHLLEQAMPSIQRVAAHLAAVYRSPRFDAEELAQIGALAVCEALQRGIHARGNRIAYVVVIARRAMRRQLGVYRSLIKTPRTHNGYQPALVVLSLDAPIWADDGATLLDRLADAAVEAAEDYAAQHDNYLDRLP
jgi:hypothetical protein